MKHHSSVQSHSVRYIITSAIKAATPAVTSPLLFTLFIASPLCVLLVAVPVAALEVALALALELAAGLVASSNGFGQLGATSSDPNWLAAHNTTPFVHPNPAWTVYSPPEPPISISLILNFSNICP